jgi:hypothetical protein
MPLVMPALALHSWHHAGGFVACFQIRVRSIIDAEGKSKPLRKRESSGDADKE